MSVVSIVAVPGAASDDQSFKTIVLFSCIGLFVSFCLMVGGIDLGAALV